MLSGRRTPRQLSLLHLPTKPAAIGTRGACLPKTVTLVPTQLATP